ncbi:MAG TPA: terminase large subunit [Rhodocyclaceae bacterium]|nr:terminase large subunit [Rhodocyclaceae bacterium]
MMAPRWSTACPDWEARIVEGRPLVPFSPLFPDEADAALEILRSLRIVDAAGSPTIDESCRQWVFDFAAAIFGAYDARIGRRLIRNFFQLVAKKNSKSTIAAAIMLTALMRNWRKSAEFLILAPTIEVANNSFGPARDMIAADEELKDILHVQANIRTITHRNTGATLKVVAADNETVSGKKAVGVLIDELWLFGKRANAENMLREATGGLASRPEGFVIYLSTQSDEPPAGIFRQKLNEFRDIRDGKVVDRKSLGVIYEFPKALIDSKGYLDPENFYISNPNLGASVDKEFLIDGLTTAQRNGPQSLCGFAAKHLNVEIGLALRSDRWTGAEYWEACADHELTLDAILERSEVVTVGIDGGGLDDLLGLAVMGRDKDTREWLLWTHAWAHNSVLERRKEIVPALQDFERDGDLTVVEYVGQDVEDVADIVERIELAGLLPEKVAIGVDQMGISEIVDALGQRNIAIEKIGGVPQGWKLNNAIKTTERKLAGGTLKHCGTRMMDWCLGNARAEPKGNAVTISKQISGSAKIDPLMATFDAVVAMGLNPESTRSVYEDRDLLIL